MALVSAMALWASFPPLNCWPLAWLAPAGWLLLVARPKLYGRRPYLAIWLAASTYWLAMLQGIRLAHPLLYFGWIALSLYLAVYIALFVGLTRIAVHRGRVSMVIAAPLVWTGLEFARAHFLSGFAMGLLGHSQTAWTTMIQVADLGGAYAVGSVIMCVAACLVRATPWGTSRVAIPAAPSGKSSDAEAGANGNAGAAESVRQWSRWPLVLAAVVWGMSFGYGSFRLRTSEVDGPQEPVLRVALIQGAFDTFYEYDPEVNAGIFVRYLELSQQAVAEHPDVDLVVWPESVFAGNLGDVVAADDAVPAPELGMSQDEFRERVDEWQEALERKNRDVSGRINRLAKDSEVYFIGGTDTQRLLGKETLLHNSAVCLGPSGEVLGRYYKMHLVIFGEYLPLGNIFPWIYDWTPMPQGITPGNQAQIFPVKGVTLVPSICFESTVPHLIRRQLSKIAQVADGPLVLVNVTNDGWFKGSAMLDLHLACAVFRAVENRRPMLVAANTGISAYINGDGRVICGGGRRAEQALYAQVAADVRKSPYGWLGDIWAAVCLVFCLGLAIIGLVHGRQAGNPGKRAE